jgi:hypothetical protein
MADIRACLPPTLDADGQGEGGVGMRGRAWTSRHARAAKRGAVFTALILFSNLLLPTETVAQTGSDAVELLAPDTLRSNGADLDWTRYTGPSGAPFQKYEVHRGANAGFTPSASTLLATILDINVTSYSDTTAGPSKTFVYKVVANSSPSVGQTVNLPADGDATKLLQPGPADGKVASLSFRTTGTNCNDYGASQGLTIGTDTDATWRSALGFDLADIPTGSSIASAKLQLWESNALEGRHGRCPMYERWSHMGPGGEWDQLDEPGRGF